MKTKRYLEYKISRLHQRSQRYLEQYSIADKDEKNKFALCYMEVKGMIKALEWVLEDGK